MQENGIPEIKQYNKKNINWSSNQTDTSESELFDEVTYQFGDIVQEFTVRYFKADPVSVISILLFMKLINK